MQFRFLRMSLGLILALAAQAALAQEPPSIPKVLKELKLGRNNTDKLVNKGEFAQKLDPKKPVLVSHCDNFVNEVVNASLFDPNSKAGARFADECMRDWSPVLAATTVDGFEKSLASVLGLLVNEKGAAFCTAFRVSQTWVATARHCYFERATGSPLRTIATTQFRMAGRATDYAIAELSCGAQPCTDKAAITSFSTLGDVLLLKVPRLADVPLPKIRFETDFRLGDQVVLIGASPEFGRANALLSDADPKGCTVAKREADCLFHNCNSGGGYSGAPIIRPALTDSGALSILGIHIEGVDTDGTQCRAPSLQGYGNVALAINDQFRGVHP
ncbi:serine protease [Massilia sp. TS11]|uniref:trypsin-like serine peptidase n=1 Tax=Massilia sp. TS11 TaxID=2908003 RepID=UPI001EDA73BC|nr:trypsin-like peptidase domain-containing protein [Massilia sp. TS11]MCG2586157.1 trypsin-like peptidase domain-containing protein [Massilia sp. TS11]